MADTDNVDTDFHSFEVLGATGLKSNSGRIDEEWHPRLRGRVAQRVFREMSDNDAGIGAFLYAVRTFIRQVDWDVVSASDHPRAIAEKEWFEGAIEDMSITWGDFISEVLSMLPYGWSFFEILYKRRLGRNRKSGSSSRFTDGKVGWRKFSIRGQESLDRWELDDEGGIQGMWQMPPPTYKLAFVPIEKALLFRTTTHKNNPEGRSVLRNAYRSWWLVKRIQEFEAIGVSRNLSGMPVLQVPPRIMSPNASAADKQIRRNLEKMLQEIHRDEREGLLIPAEVTPDGKATGYKFSLLSASGRPIDTHQIIVRYNQDIAMSTLSEFVRVGMDQHGSFALVDNKTDKFAVALGSFLDIIADVVNRFAIPRLATLNGVPEEFWPRIAHGDIEKPDIEQYASYLSSMAGIGALEIDSAVQRQVREIGSLPMPEDAKPAPPTPGIVAIDADAKPPDVGEAPSGAGAKPPSVPVIEAEPVEAPGPDAPGPAAEESNPAALPTQDISDVKSEAVPAVAPSEALNGAQITSLVTIMEGVSNGTMPRESALALITTAFPITRERAENILGTIGLNATTPPAAAPDA